MKYCPKCGAELNGAAFCPKCGFNTLSRSSNPAVAVTRQDDCKSVGWDIISFLFPIIGWILWAVWRKDYPIKAHGTAMWAWISFGLSMVCYLIMAMAGD